MLTDEEVAEIAARCRVAQNDGWKYLHVSADSVLTLLATIEELREELAQAQTALGNAH